MTTPNSSQAVRQAVALLRDRLTELRAEVTTLESEAAEISAALQSLGADSAALTQVTNATVGGRTMKGAGVTLERRSVRPAIQTLIDSRNHVFSNEEILTALAPKFPDRETTKLRANIRSALFQMVEAGSVVRQGRGLHASPCWHPTNAESPAATGPSVVPAPTEEGRTDDVAKAHDHNDHVPGWNDIDGRGTAVLGAAL